MDSHLLKSHSKMMATVFWGAKCIIMLDFPKRSTITEVDYANLLDQFRTVIREKCRDKLPQMCFVATGQRESPQ